MRYWSGENPREHHQKPLHCERVTVWCAISVIGIIGPYFFEENERAVTMDAVRYRDMIEEFFLPSLEEMDIGGVWFQQDGLHYQHTPIDMRERAERNFKNRLGQCIHNEGRHLSDVIFKTV